MNKDITLTDTAQIERRNNREERSSLTVSELPDGLGTYSDNVDAENLKSPLRHKSYEVMRAIQAERKGGEWINEETGEVVKVGDSIAGRSCGMCCRYTHSESKTVTISRNVEHGTVGVQGLIRCGSVWACPVCRKKITSTRGGELREIEDKFRATGGTLHHITFTVPHTKKDRPADIYGDSAKLTGLSGAQRLFKQSRLWRKMKEEIGYVADVRAVEATYGKKNGYHIHIHQLLYCLGPAEVTLWEDAIYAEWRRCCERAGLNPPNREHGVKVKTLAEGKSDYLAKFSMNEKAEERWGASEELALSIHKTLAKNGNLTIQELEFCLIDAQLREKSDLSRPEAVAILRAFYEDMKGHRMLQWGGEKGFKKRMLGAEEVSDSEIVSNEKNEHEPLATIKHATYLRIYDTGHLPELLRYAEKDGVDGVLDFFNRYDKIFGLDGIEFLSDTAQRWKPPDGKRLLSS